MFKTIKNALKTSEVRKRLLYTLVLIVIFRLGCFITIPGVDTFALSEAMTSNNGIGGLINIISGGAFSRFSIFAMTISPYITASIVIQLLAMVIPALERLAKEGGEEGIISKANDGIVVLATGNLEKKLTVKAKRFTKAAKEKIEAVGGKTEVI